MRSANSESGESEGAFGRGTGRGLEAMNKCTPKVTVVIPVRNDEVYLRECLDSVVGQTLADIEIVCIDDASTDGSRDILEEYARRDSRVRLNRYETNRSASQARKDGALAAAGEYVMFLDADDYLELNACDTVYREMRNHGVDILHFGTSVVNAGNVPQARLENLEKFIRPYPRRLEGKAVFEGCFRQKLYGYSIWNKLYSAALCRQAFLRIPDGAYPKAQDLFAFFVLAYFARSYVGLPDAHCHHYRFGAGLTGHNQMSLDKFAVHCTQARVSQRIKRFLEEEGGFDQYREDYQRIHDDLVFECAWNWLRNLAPADQGRGFDLLRDAWGSKDVAACLVWRKEYDRLNRAYQAARAEVDALHNSRSYRIGRALSFVPDVIMNWRKRGAR